MVGWCWPSLCQGFVAFCCLCCCNSLIFIVVLAFAAELCGRWRRRRSQRGREEEGKRRSCASVPLDHCSTCGQGFGGVTFERSCRVLFTVKSLYGSLSHGKICSNSSAVERPPDTREAPGSIPGCCNNFCSSSYE